MAQCKRCFHIIGEHLLCLKHGGESGFSKAAEKLKLNPIDYPPMPENFDDPWWNFLDKGEPIKTEKKGAQMTFSEMVP